MSRVMHIEGGYFSAAKQKQPDLPHPTTVLVCRVGDLTVLLDSVVLPWDHESDLIPPPNIVVDERSDAAWLIPPADGFYIGRLHIDYDEGYEGDWDCEVSLDEWRPADPEDLRVNGADGVLIPYREENEEAEKEWVCDCGATLREHDDNDRCPPPATDKANANGDQFPGSQPFEAGRYANHTNKVP